MFEPINKLIKKKGALNLGVFDAAKICYQAREVIEDLVPEARGKLKVVSYRFKKLKVASSDSIVLHRIKMSQSEIIDKVRTKTGIEDFEITYSPQG